MWLECLACIALCYVRTTVAMQHSAPPVVPDKSVRKVSVHLSFHITAQPALAETTPSQCIQEAFAVRNFAVEDPDSAPRLPHDYCLKGTVLSIEDPPNAKGWMTWHDWEREMKSLDVSVQRVVKVGIDGFPCAAQGCCRHSMLIRREGTDAKVLRHALNEYASVLVRLHPWGPQKGILEGGGNIGVATSLFAFMFPDTPIVVLEPDAENCDILKQNTARFANVHVRCRGLWGKDQVAVKVMPGLNSWEQWGYRLEHAPAGSPGAILTSSAEALLKELEIPGFDLAKIDIEGSEYPVFEEGVADLDWLREVEVLAIEFHRMLVGSWRSDQASVTSLFKRHGLYQSRHGEYSVFATEPLHRRLLGWHS